jgi:hypothetical protein
VKKPSVRTQTNQSLFMQSPPSLREQLEPNLKKSLNELLRGSESTLDDNIKGKFVEHLIITDPRLPFPLRIQLELDQ